MANSKDDGLMNEILGYINLYCRDNGQSPPSTRALGTQFGLSNVAVFRYLKEMAQRGMIGYEDGVITTLATEKLRPDIVGVPILGSIPCGSPEEELEDTQGIVPFSRSLLGPGYFFALRASGTSMINAGIKPGDLVICRRQNSADSGDIVAALVDDTLSTLKMLRHDGERFYLHPLNPEFADIYPDESLRIQGVAVKVVGDLKSETFGTL